MAALLNYFKLASTNDRNITCMYHYIWPGMCCALLLKFKNPRADNSLSWLNAVKSDVNTLSQQLQLLGSQKFTI